jgi:DNA repair exonuclease SbcCD nuclease subunit
MTKVTLITDTHWGVRNDSMHFIDYYEKFYRDIFFPKIDKEGIKTVLMLGDTFDRRKYINFVSWKKTKEIYFDELHKRNIEVYILVGNHDTSYKNTNDVNSPELLLEEYDNITVIASPQTIHLKYENESYDICMMPWICSDNYERSLAELKNTKATLCMGHFEIAGFSMHRGMSSHEGLNRDIFKRFDMVFSGHYHHRSTQDNITYLGNPYQITWQDYGDDRGFYIFDLSDRTLEFVENTNVMFHRIIYDDKQESISEINDKDLSLYKNCYVKVIVVNKTNPYLFDKFMNNLYNINPIDITIAEDFTDLMEGTENDVLDQAEDTLTVINKYVESLEEDDIDVTRLKNIIRELYVESLSTEKV